MSDSGLKELYHYSSLATHKAARGTPRLTHEDVRGMSGEIAKFAGAVTDSALLLEIGAHLDLNPSSTLLNRRKLALAQELGLVARWTWALA